MTTQTAPKFKTGDIIIGLDHVYPYGALRVSEVHPDGSVETAPEGGGFVGTMSPASLIKNRMRLVTEEEKRNVPIYRAEFSMDCMPEGRNEWLPGWSAGDNWNGWACPSFEKEAADLFCRIAAKDKYMMRTEYDPKTDSYVSYAHEVDEKKGSIEDDPPEVDDRAKGHDITVIIDGKQTKVHVYDIGNYNWCWTERKPRKKRRSR